MLATPCFTKDLPVGATGSSGLSRERSSTSHWNDIVQDFFWHGCRHVMSTKLIELRVNPYIARLVLDHPAAFSIVCAIFLAAGLIQVRRGWSPINQLRARLIGLREGRARRLEGEYPTEVEPLVGDLNALLDERLEG